MKENIGESIDSMIIDTLNNSKRSPDKCLFIFMLNEVNPQHVSELVNQLADKPNLNL